MTRFRFFDSSRHRSERSRQSRCRCLQVATITTGERGCRADTAARATAMISVRLLEDSTSSIAADRLLESPAAIRGATAIWSVPTAAATLFSVYAAESISSPADQLLESCLATS